NPKTIVLDRYGDLVRFNPTLLELCSQLCVQPRVCEVGKPNQKGGVERSGGWEKVPPLASWAAESSQRTKRQAAASSHRQRSL
ncbi:MAG: hypothetical protein MJE77_08480, partial [Proteobacteria bacterium]|nr:hypothetical protein [Pseudomonadota bacterium]